MSEFKYVPVDPTDEMIEASKGFIREWHPVDIEHLYKSMIAAAPEQTELGRALEYALEEIRESLDDLTITNLSQVATGIRDLKESVRNAALDDAVFSIEHEGKGYSEYGVLRPHYEDMAEIVRQMKSTSDSRTEFSDTEILDWILKNNGLVELRGGQYYCGYGPYGTVLNGALADSPREAIKAAMQADREGS